MEPKMIPVRATKGSKLSLGRETLKALSDKQLAAAAGGKMPSMVPTC